MNLLNRYKNILIILLVVVAAFVVYSVFFTGGDTRTLVAEDIDPAQTAVEQELIALLLELRSINLDLSIFDDSKFQSLTDFSQELVPEPVGRENPFAPLQ